MDHFPTETAGCRLPGRPEIVELADGERSRCASPR